jgi:hypothetical protein
MMLKIIAEPVKKWRKEKKHSELAVLMSDKSEWWLSDLANLKNVKLATIHNRARNHGWLFANLLNPEKILCSDYDDGGGNSEWKKLKSRPRTHNLYKIKVGSCEY